MQIRVSNGHSTGSGSIGSGIASELAITRGRGIAGWRATAPPDEALVDVEELPDAEFPEELPEELPEEEAPEAEFPDFAKEDETVVLDAFLPPACR